MQKAITRLLLWQLRLLTKIYLYTCFIAIFLLEWLPMPFKGTLIPDTVSFLGLSSFYDNNRIPGPWGLPIIGHLHLLNPKNIYQTLHSWACRYGPLYKIRLGRMPVVILSNPDLVKMLFEKTSVSARPPLFLTTGIMEGCGLASVNGDLWREQRSMVTSAIDKYLLHNKSMLFESRVQYEMKRLLKDIGTRNGSAFDPMPLIGIFVGSMMEGIILGNNFQAPIGKLYTQLQVGHISSSLVHLTNWLNYFPFLRFLPCFGNRYDALKIWKVAHHKYLTRMWNLQMNDDSHIHVAGLIYFYKEEMKAKGLNPKSAKNQNQAVHVLADLFGASVKKIKLTVYWALFHFMERPDVQLKMQNEMSNVARNGSICLNDMHNLPFTCASILEVQRLSSVTPLGIPHWTINDIEIGCHIVIPKDTLVIALQYTSHTHPHYWNLPCCFMPERFLDSTRTRVSVPLPFMPYSIGQRKCIGESLANSCLFLIIANIIHKFTIIPDCDAKQEPRAVPGFSNYPPKFKIRAL